MEICVIKDLSFTYSSSQKEVLHQLNLTIQEGEFILLCGQSGCGKTTLLRHLKPELKPHGKRNGTITYEGDDVTMMNAQESAAKIGYVMQNPDNQIVTDKVWHELAFGLENLGVPSSTIRRRVAEMASFFGMEDSFHSECDTLSGGQKQMLNLASIMLLQPKLLLLDEPTSQLDPIAATEFLDTLKKINDEFGTTIVLIEHRLEEVFQMADRIVVMEQGKIIAIDQSRKITNALKDIQVHHPMLEGFPTSVRIHEAFDHDAPCPIRIKEAKQYLKTYFNSNVTAIHECAEKTYASTIIDLRNVHFRYEKNGKEILKGVNLKVNEAEICMLLGSNGAGKSTLLNLLTGMLKAERGSITIFGKALHKMKEKDISYLAYVPQNPTTLFVKDKVEDDLMAMCKAQRDEKQALVLLQHYMEVLQIQDLMQQHPYDLSGGEQQKVALCKVLLKQPKLLLLDEPTKGLDAFAKKTLANILHTLKEEGISMLMVSHDIEFGASYATMCALLFDGDIISQDTPNKFFGGNRFYTTAANKISKDFYDQAVTCEDVIRLCAQHQK